MPESGPYGSVRGALSNERPYRDYSDSKQLYNLITFFCLALLRSGSLILQL